MERPKKALTTLVLPLFTWQHLFPSSKDTGPKQQSHRNLGLKALDFLDGFSYLF